MGTLSMTPTPADPDTRALNAGGGAPAIPAVEPIAAKRERFLTELRKVDLPAIGHPDRRNALRRFQRFCRNHVQELKDAGYTIFTVKNALTEYRHAVKDLLDGDELKFTLRYFTLTRDEWWSLRRQYEAKVTAEAEKTRPIDGNKILEAALGNLNSAAYTRQAVALMVLTGRRSIEVLKLGGVSAISGRNDVVMFSGQAKTKEVEVPPYEIPVLAPADKLIAAWNELRKKKDFSALTPDEVNARCAKSLNETAEAVYGACVDGRKIKPKDLRAIYGTICCAALKPESMSRTVYLATILGHRMYDQDVDKKQATESRLNRSIADSYEDFHLSKPIAGELGFAGAREGTDDISAELVGEADADGEEEEPDGAKQHTV
jgi:hypothetical protein